MLILHYLLSIAGATMLLLFAVRLVRTGIERAFGSHFQQLISRRTHSLSAATIGLFLAVVLQSSAAVSVLVSGFATNGAIAVSTGIAAVIGADLGSAIVVKILSLSVDWMIPALMALGGGLYLKSRFHNLRQFGRVFLGIGLILLSLQMLRDAVEPIQNGDLMPAIAAYLESDLISAFLLGMVLAFVMHSSVAVVLMAVSIVAVASMPFVAAISIVLGANLGGALVPMWLTRDLQQPGKQIPIANFIVRGSTAVVALLLLMTFKLDFFPEQYQTADGLVLIHLLFNAVLIIYLPFTGIISSLMDRLVYKPETKEVDEHTIWDRTALDRNLIDSPQFAIACVHREVLRMSQLIEYMVNPVMKRYAEGDQDSIDSHQALDLKVNKALTDIRLYVADIGEHELVKSDRRKMRNFMEYAINLEACGDIVAKRLLPLASEKATKNIQFSDEGWNELLDMHKAVVANMSLAFNVLVSEDVEAARELMLSKNVVTAQERDSRKSHLQRILSGSEKSLESSDLHLETLRALKDLNSQIASVCYPILHRSGLLLENRLMNDAGS